MIEDFFTDEYGVTSTQRLVPSTQPVGGTRARPVCTAIALLLTTLTAPAPAFSFEGPYATFVDAGGGVMIDVDRKRNLLRLEAQKLKPGIG